MKFDWHDDRCILCCQTVESLSEEHIIPDALGGRLVVHFLCKPCNDRLGARVDANAKRDPQLAQRILAFGEHAPERAKKLQENVRIQVKSARGIEDAEIRNGVARTKTKRLADGSLLVPTDAAAKKVREMMREDGESDDAQERAARTIADGPEDVPIRLSEKITVIKWKHTGLRADPVGEPVNEVLLAKIAYEFLALLIGRDVYRDVPALAALRTSLTTGVLDDSIEVERLIADRKDFIHGLYFEGNDPHAKIQVRLFGDCAYRVHLRTLSVSTKHYRYTHHLGDGEEWCDEQ